MHTYAAAKFDTIRVSFHACVRHRRDDDDNNNNNNNNNGVRLDIIMPVSLVEKQ